MGSHRWKNGLLNTLTMLMLAPTLGACASVKTVEWTEDVRLSDGRTIVVQRASEFRRVMDVGAGFERGWNFYKASIATGMLLPTNRRLVWEGILEPIVLDTYSNSIYLICVAGGPGRIQWKVPRHEFYVAFRLEDDQWKRIPISQIPDALRPNLFLSSYTYFIEQDARTGAHVDIALKQKLDSNPQIVELYRRLIRLPDPKTMKK
jgi:hypothetical protein